MSPPSLDVVPLTIQLLKFKLFTTNLSLFRYVGTLKENEVAGFAVFKQ